MTQRKIALIIGYGQSNENGTAVAPRIAGTTIANTDIANNVRHIALFGNPTVSQVTATTVSTMSMFHKLAEHLAMELGAVVKYVNKAIGGTAVTDWVGFNTTESRLYAQGEVGYDPNSRIAGLIAEVQLAVSEGYEVWTCTAGHQQDVVNYANTRTVEQAIAASAHIQNRLVAAGASKVFVGITPRWVGHAKQAEWDAPDGALHRIQRGVLSLVPGSIPGGDLSSNVDPKLCANDNLSNVHLNHVGICWAAEKWLNAIKAAKLI